MMYTFISTIPQLTIFKILIAGDVDAKSSINHGNNTQRGTTNLNSSDSRRNSNSNRNSTSGRNGTTNPSNSINCIKTQTNKRALIPVVINNSIEIQALCDPCADITIIQQSCIPADAVVHPWTDGQFQVVDHKINPIEDVVLPDLNTKILPSQAQLIPKFAKLSTIQQAQLDAVIGKFSDVFYSDDDNIGLCPYIEFKIDFQHDKPIRCRPCRLSEPDRQFLNMQNQKWLKQGICRPSNSTYAAPAFIVEQPFHESTPRRVVINYPRTINSITKLDPHPIDHMEDVIKRIVRKCYISKRDVKSAFNTIRIRETDIFKIGFVTPDGHYELLRMPFGVSNGPSTMTRAIKLAYEHLAPHNDGERPDPDRTASVQRYSQLKSIHEVRSFLGFANQFRKNIQNYAVIAKPLTSVLKGLERKTSNATIILTDDQQRTFETLKTAITTAPILAYFKQGLPTFLETDASYSGLGAVLSQDQNGKRRVIEYASRTLKDAETRYHSNELECIAVYWALTEKFRLYLLGHKFQLITDNYTTADVVAKSAVNRKFARYLVDLAQFDFTTVH
ncbi:retrovirus-related Pol polyprotein from transposon 17.6 [Trichonephila clavipes]|uniref:Retrovirus-related Pol polyprotein from transposon 17.6 n=1 Tax=Trichonephila clavipes TaxID=2585209 RepID=A0A8X6RP67_TRICX|nr:retrovirus-related Pol polyprotein from transposon 17.6 [Trichonephila clavipes]